MIGRLADTVNIGDGGSSDVWDLSCRTVLAGLRDAIANVAHDDGTDLGRAAATAGAADVALVVVGYTYVDEGEYIGETDPSLMSLFPPGDEADVVDQFRSKRCGTRRSPNARAIVPACSAAVATAARCACPPPTSH